MIVIDTIMYVLRPTENLLGSAALFHNKMNLLKCRWKFRKSLIFEVLRTVYCRLSMAKEVEFALALVIVVWACNERQTTLLGIVKQKFQSCFKWFTTWVARQAICCSAGNGSCHQMQHQLLQWIGRWLMCLFCLNDDLKRHAWMACSKTTLCISDLFCSCP